MKTITVTLDNDKDAEYLMHKLRTATKFQGEVEIVEMDDAISDEDLEAFDARIETFYSQPFNEAAYSIFQKEIKDKFGISYLFVRPQ